MCKSDIAQAQPAPYYTRSEGMYINPDKPVEQMNLDELQRVLCGKANGDVLACEACESKCKYGRRIVELLEPVATKPDNKAKVRGLVHCGKMRTHNAHIRYLKAIASGDVRKWMADNGYRSEQAVKNVIAFGQGMTPEDAKRRLVEMGTHDEPEATTEALVVETSAAEELVASVTPVSLKVALLEGKYFSYVSDIRGLKLNLNGVSIDITPEDVESICAEIKQAVAIMTGGPVVCTQ